MDKQFGFLNRILNPMVFSDGICTNCNHLGVLHSNIGCIAGPMNQDCGCMSPDRRYDV
mgnify:FL=1